MTKNIKILIVDDHHLVRQGIKLILNNQTELNLEVTEVDCGQKAIDLYKTNKFDLILMDINMDQMNGMDATKAIIEYDKNVKIIALSMHNETFMIKKMLECGASGYILKDTESTELIKAIKTVLGGQKYFTNEVSLKLIGEFKEKQRIEFNDDLPNTFRISKREIEILTLISKQMTNDEIATELDLSKRTVDAHRQKMLEKLGVKNTAGLIMYGLKNHLISL